MTDQDVVNLNSFMAKYAEDGNEWWKLSSGRHQCLFDEALDKIADLIVENKRLREATTDIVVILQTWNHPYPATEDDTLEAAHDKLIQTWEGSK